jgi:tRNA(Ile)-lysidine synthase TilS/MesJ
MPITIIRPLCLCQEQDIQQFAIQQNYQKQIKNCPYEHTTNRQLIKQVFNNLQQLNPQARYSIWNALETEQKLTEY